MSLAGWITLALVWGPVTVVTVYLMLRVIGGPSTRPKERPRHRAAK